MGGPEFFLPPLSQMNFAGTPPSSELNYAGPRLLPIELCWTLPNQFRYDTPPIELNFCIPPNLIFFVPIPIDFFFLTDIKTVWMRHQYLPFQMLQCQ